MQISEFNGKTAFVTGGGSGIGARVAQMLADRGANVMVTDMNANAANMVAENITSAGGRAAALSLDVRNPDVIAAAVNSTVDTFGRLDMAVNNAGVVSPAYPLHKLPRFEWDMQVATNLSGVFFCMQAQLRKMLAEGAGGSIVNTASILGVVAVPKRGAYTAMKHGVVGLTKSAALDYAKDGIRINAIAPGYVATPLLAERSEQELEAIAARHPLNRLADASEVAEAVLFLLSERASFMTGTVLNVDGGYTTQ